MEGSRFTKALRVGGRGALRILDGSDPPDLGQAFVAGFLS